MCEVTPVLSWQRLSGAAGRPGALLRLFLLAFAGYPSSPRPRPSYLAVPPLEPVGGWGSQGFPTTETAEATLWEAALAFPIQSQLRKAVCLQQPTSQGQRQKARLAEFLL